MQGDDEGHGKKILSLWSLNQTNALIKTFIILPAIINPLSDVNHQFVREESFINNLKGGIFDGK